MNKIIILLVGLVVLLVGVIAYLALGRDEEVPPPPITNNEPVATSTVTTATTTEPVTTIGRSVDGREIKAYHFGEGDKRVVFVGGVHGGYAWNTSAVAYELIDHLEKNPSFVPEGVRVTVIPVLNPDGLILAAGTSSRFAVADVDKTIAGTIDARLNANDVDLNRNFDCDWQEEGTWQSRTVSGGDSAFSEPESAAIRDFINKEKPSAVVVWYAAAGGVFASNCHGDVLSDTSELTKRFAEASGYRAYESFNFYEITGDMVNWLAKIRIPAISVLLTNHNDVEWDKNRAGVEAVLDYYASAE